MHVFIMGCLFIQTKVVKREVARSCVIHCVHEAVNVDFYKIIVIHRIEEKKLKCYMDIYSKV